MSNPDSDPHASLRRICAAAFACEQATVRLNRAKEACAEARAELKEADACLRRLVFAEAADTGDRPLFAGRDTPAAEDDEESEDDEDDLVNSVAWEGSEPPNFDDWRDDRWELGPGPGGNGV